MSDATSFGPKVTWPNVIWPKSQLVKHHLAECHLVPSLYPTYLPSSKLMLTLLVWHAYNLANLNVG